MEEKRTGHDIEEFDVSQRYIQLGMHQNLREINFSISSHSKQTFELIRYYTKIEENLQKFEECGSDN